MPALLGNKSHQKYKTPKARLDVFKKFCEHVSKGYSRDSFPECDDDTIQLMIKQYPNELPLDMLSAAQRKARKLYETIGWQGTIGDLPKFNAKSWQFIGMNKFGYTLKQSVETSDAQSNEQLVKDLEAKVVERLEKERRQRAAAIDEDVEECKS